jgi:hypothetical protein
VALKCASVSRGPVEKEDAKFSVHAGGGAENGGEKKKSSDCERIVGYSYSSCAPLRDAERRVHGAAQDAERRVHVLRVCQVAILLHVAT